MKKQNVNLNGPLNYLAGVSSPTAANLNVQGLTDSAERNYELEATPKPKKKFHIPRAFFAGFSSPSAANITQQGLSAHSTFNFRNMH